MHSVYIVLWNIIIELDEILHISSTISTSAFMFYNYHEIVSTVDSLIHKHSINI